MTDKVRLRDSRQSTRRTARDRSGLCARTVHRTDRPAGSLGQTRAGLVQPFGGRPAPAPKREHQVTRAGPGGQPLAGPVGRTTGHARTALAAARHAQPSGTRRGPVAQPGQGPGAQQPFGAPGSGGQPGAGTRRDSSSASPEQAGQPGTPGQPGQPPGRRAPRRARPRAAGATADSAAAAPAVRRQAVPVPGFAVAGLGPCRGPRRDSRHPLRHPDTGDPAPLVPVPGSAQGAPGTPVRPGVLVRPALLVRPGARRASGSATPPPPMGAPVPLPPPGGAPIFPPPPAPFASPASGPAGGAGRCTRLRALPCLHPRRRPCFRAAAEVADVR